MADRTHSPRPIGSVSAISETNVHDDQHPKDHNPLHHAAHYLKNAVTLESSSDETRRESLSADHAHVNNHGGEEAEKEFWEKHRKHDDGKTHCKHDARESHHHHGNKSLEHAEGHGKFQKMVEKLRTSDSAAREGGSMTG